MHSNILHSDSATAFTRNNVYKHVMHPCPRPLHTVGYNLRGVTHTTLLDLRVSTTDHTVHRRKNRLSHRNLMLLRIDNVSEGSNRRQHLEGI